MKPPPLVQRSHGRARPASPRSDELAPAVPGPTRPAATFSPAVERDRRRPLRDARERL